jgi:hypothetical protein
VQIPLAQIQVQEQRFFVEMQELVLNISRGLE